MFDNIQACIVASSLLFIVVNYTRQKQLINLEILDDTFVTDTMRSKVPKSTETQVQHELKSITKPQKDNDNR